MNKRMFEVIFLVSIISFVLFFVLYIFYFDGYCGKISGKIGLNQHQTSVYMGKCTDYKICSVKNIKYDEYKRKVESWTCQKNTVPYFEGWYYQGKLYNIFN